jgi:hypothetical protein
MIPLHRYCERERKWVASKHLTFELAKKSATRKVERRWISLFVAAMGAIESAWHSARLPQISKVNRAGAGGGAAIGALPTR